MAAVRRAGRTAPEPGRRPPRPRRGGPLRSGCRRGSSAPGHGAIGWTVNRAARRKGPAPAPADCWRGHAGPARSGWRRDWRAAAPAAVAQRADPAMRPRPRASLRTAVRRSRGGPAAPDCRPGSGAPGRSADAARRSPAGPPGAAEPPNAGSRAPPRGRRARHLRVTRAARGFRASAGVERQWASGFSGCRASAVYAAPDCGRAKARTRSSCESSQARPKPPFRLARCGSIRQKSKSGKSA